LARKSELILDEIQIPIINFKYFENFIDKDGIIKMKFFKNFSMILGESDRITMKYLIDKLLINIKNAKIVLSQQWMGKLI